MLASLLQPYSSFHQGTDVFPEQGVVRVPGAKCSKFAQEGLDRRSSVHDQLASHKIHGLNPVCSLIQGEDFGVSQVLFKRVLAGEAVAAQALNGRFTNPEAHVGAVSFHDRRDEIDERITALAALARLATRRPGPTRSLRCKP